MFVGQDLPDIRLKAVTQALNQDLPALPDHVGGSRRPREDEVAVFHFVQNWGNSALAFDARDTIAMQAICQAYTTVVELPLEQGGLAAAVYVNGRLAYTLECGHGAADAVEGRRSALYLADRVAESLYGQRAALTRYPGCRLPATAKPSVQRPLT